MKRTIEAELQRACPVKTVTKLLFLSPIVAFLNLIACKAWANDSSLRRPGPLPVRAGVKL